MKIEKRSTEELLEEISKKLDKLSGILAIQNKDTDVQIKILINLGFQPNEIAKLLGLTSNAVRLRKFKSSRK